MTAALSWLWHAPGSALGHVRNNRILIGKNPNIYCNNRMILACWTPFERPTWTTALWASGNSLPSACLRQPSSVTFVPATETIKE